LCPIDLTDRSRCDWLFLKVLEDIFDIFTICILEIPLGGFERVGRGMFSKILELARHLRTDNIPPMTEVLKGLYKYDSRPLYSFHEEVSPVILCALKEGQRKQ
jgi:hypothetical protein